MWSLMRSYLDATQAPEHIKTLLWCEAFSTAMDVWNILSNHKEQPSKEEMWMGEMPKYSKKLSIFGEIGIVNELGITGHTQNKGYDALFLGYDKESTKGVFRMMKLKTWKICVSRDVTWL